MEYINKRGGGGGRGRILLPREMPLTTKEEEGDPVARMEEMERVITE